MNGRGPSSSTSYSKKTPGGGYAHKSSRAGKKRESSDGFYGGFKNSEEFYDFFSGAKDWKAEANEEARQSKYSKTSDFYGTHSSSGPRDQRQ